MMVRYGIIFQILIFLLFRINGFSSNQIAFDQPNSLIIGEYTSFLKDADQSFTIDEVWEKFNSGELNPCDHKVFARPASSDSYWFVFTVKSLQDEELWVNLNNSNLDSLHFYKLDSDGNIVNQHLTGVFLGRETRLKNTSTFWFPLIDAGDTTTYHFLIKAFSAGMMEVPIELGTYTNLTDTLLKNEFVSAFFIGSLILMLIYNVFIFLFSRDKIYLYYLAYIGCIMFNTTFFNNYPVIERFLGVIPAHKYALSWVSLGFIFMGLFIINYLDLKNKFKIFYKIISVELVIISLIAMSNFFISLVEIVNLFELAVTVFVLTCLITAYYCLYKKVPNAGVYSIGWSVMVLSSMVYLLVVNGILPHTLFLRDIMYFGVMSEIAIFSIGLARRINSLRLEHERLNRRLIIKNEELQFNNESLDAFNYNVSHDLKAVLTNSNSMARMAEKYNRVSDSAKLDQIIGRLLEVTDTGMKTVENFLLLGSADNGVTSTGKNHNGIEDEIKLILESNELLSKIDVDIVKNTIRNVKINKKVMEHIFLYLFNSSIKNNKDQPRVEVEFYRQGTYCNLVYNDRGFDLKPDEEKDDKFGIPGYYSLKRLISSYNGKIEVETGKKGVIFVISLPKNLSSE